MVGKICQLMTINIYPFIFLKASLDTNLISFLFVFYILHISNSLAPC